MYEWVSHVWSPIVGCSHQCSYCYVKKYRHLPEVPILNEADLPKLGKERVIFVGHMCDMFSEAVTNEHIAHVMSHCNRFPENVYVFQTKNPARLFNFTSMMPLNVYIGTTVETNREDLIHKVSHAPTPSNRLNSFQRVFGKDWYSKETDLEHEVRMALKFITIEPVMDFDVDEFVKMIVEAKPNFINIGADSKGHGLVEPSKEKLQAFIAAMDGHGIEIRKKMNLGRLGIEVIDE
jgi:hypothetical protein